MAHVVGDQLLQRRSEVMVQRVASDVLTGQFPRLDLALDVVATETSIDASHSQTRQNVLENW